MIVLAIDPGKEKCGVAAVTGDEHSFVVLQRCVVPAGEMARVLPALAERHQPQRLLLGNATTSRAWREKLIALLPQLPLEEVEERGSTLEARVLFWRHHPPRGWRRVLPLSLQSPPVPLDDFAAVVLAQRFFAAQFPSSS